MSENFPSRPESLPEITIGDLLLTPDRAGSLIADIDIVFSNLKAAVKENGDKLEIEDIERASADYPDVEFLLKNPIDRLLDSETETENQFISRIDNHDRVQKLLRSATDSRGDPIKSKTTPLYYGRMKLERWRAALEIIHGQIIDVPEGNGGTDFGEATA